MNLDSRKDYRQRRHMRLRKHVQGTAERPRMAVVVSNRHMYVQFIDDERAMTLAAASTMADEVVKKNVVAAKQLGQRAAAAAIEKGIQKVVFDRGGHRFHGRVKAISDGAREAGLKF